MSQRILSNRTFHACIKAMSMYQILIDQVFTNNVLHRGKYFYIDTVN